jgi:hypothetical protein
MPPEMAGAPGAGDLHPADEGPAKTAAARNKLALAIDKLAAQTK